MNLRKTEEVFEYLVSCFSLVEDGSSCKHSIPTQSYESTIDKKQRFICLPGSGGGTCRKHAAPRRSPAVTLSIKCLNEITADKRIALSDKAVKGHEWEPETSRVVMVTTIVFLFDEVLPFPFGFNCTNEYL
jgi:hypothetical protein